MNDNQKAVTEILKEVEAMGDKIRKLDAAFKEQGYAVQQSVLAGLLNDRMLQLTTHQQAVIKAMMVTRAKKVFSLYVQPEEFNQWQSTGRNLLTISRSGTFPFTIPLTVVI